MVLHLEARLDFGKMTRGLCESASCCCKLQRRLLICTNPDLYVDPAGVAAATVDIDLTGQATFTVQYL